MSLAEDVPVAVRPAPTGPRQAARLEFDAQVRRFEHAKAQLQATIEQHRNSRRSRRHRPLSGPSPDQGLLVSLAPPPRPAPQAFPQPRLTLPYPGCRAWRGSRGSPGGRRRFSGGITGCFVNRQVMVLLVTALV